MNIDDFKKAKIVAMKERDKNTVMVLEAVISKLMLSVIEKKAKGEEMTDADSVAVLQKVEKELLEEKEGYLKGARAESAAVIDGQLEVIKKYLPKMLSSDEIKAIMLQLSDRSLPAVMKHFKTNYSGKCDMRLVGEVLKGL